MTGSLHQIHKATSEGIAYLTTDQIEFVLSRLSSNRDRLLVNLLYDLGCTLKELLGIRVRDLQLEERKVTITSPSSKRASRVCVFSGRSKGLIERQLSDMQLCDKRLAYLFTSSHGRPLTARRAHQIITNTLTELGFGEAASPQSIKYSHIINAYLSFVPVHLIKKQVGLTRQRIVSILADIDTPELGQYESFFKNG